MRKLLIAAFTMVALVAYAGTRATDSQLGQIPNSATSGVSMGSSEGCRASIRVGDGGTINGGTIKYVYHDPVVGDGGWVPGRAEYNCALESNNLPDGGAPPAQMCPGITPGSQFGRVGIYAVNVVGADGGTPNGLGPDAGQNVIPLLRIECWGPNLP